MRDSPLKTDEPVDWRSLTHRAESSVARPRSSRGSSGRRRAIKVQAPTIVALALAIIQREFPETVPVSKLSAYVGLDRFALCRCFRGVTGTSVREYVMNKRVSHACELLRTTAYPITEIAQLLGFSDLPRFDKVFRKRTGLSPREYRHRGKIAQNY